MPANFGGGRGRAVHGEDDGDQFVRVRSAGRAGDDRRRRDHLVERDGAVHRRQRGSHRPTGGADEHAAANRVSATSTGAQRLAARQGVRPRGAVAVDRARAARASVERSPRSPPRTTGHPPLANLAVSRHCLIPGRVLESAGHRRFRHPGPGCGSFDHGGQGGGTQGAVDRVVSAVAILAGACSSPGATRSSTATTAAAAGATGPSTGAPLPSPGCARPRRPRRRRCRAAPGHHRRRSRPLVPAHDPADPARARAPARRRRSSTASVEGATIEADTTQFGPKAQADGFIAVFPEGTGSPVSWDIDPSTSGAPQPRPRLHERHAQLVGSRTGASTSRGSTPRACPTARCSRRCWPAPWPIASPPSPRWPASWSCHAVRSRAGVCRSSPSTAPPTRSSTSTVAWAPRCLNNALSGKTAPTTDAATGRPQRQGLPGQREGLGGEGRLQPRGDRHEGERRT